MFFLSHLGKRIQISYCDLHARSCRPMLWRPFQPTARFSSPSLCFSSTDGLLGHEDSHSFLPQGLHTFFSLPGILWPLSSPGQFLSFQQVPLQCHYLRDLAFLCHFPSLDLISFLYSTCYSLQLFCLLTLLFIFCFPFQNVSSMRAETQSFWVLALFVKQMKIQVSNFSTIISKMPAE